MLDRLPGEVEIERSIPADDGRLRERQQRKQHAAQKSHNNWADMNRHVVSIRWRASAKTGKTKHHRNERRTALRR
ncbi:MAG: hypothetical protein AW07_03480 [Candidatus Accumulibacter sp. SK-11]|nr:MAG: hypothetical protein AW07_03480 [Candidatus Accumulibacter sp. SK-11]